MDALILNGFKSIGSTKNFHNDKHIFGVGVTVFYIDELIETVQWQVCEHLMTVR